MPGWGHSPTTGNEDPEVSNTRINAAKTCGDIVSVFAYSRFNNSAECSCGWDGRRRWLRAHATIDALEHGHQSEGCQPDWPLVRHVEPPVDSRLRAWVWAPILIFAAILGGGLLAPDAHADNPTDIPGCVTAPWGFLGSQLRILCDSPLRPDGSWDRLRMVVIPAHHVPFTCNTYGGSYYSSTTCNGGYDVDLQKVSQETYPVNPEIVLGDEPGWIAH